MGHVIGELLDAGLLHGDTLTVAGAGGLARYRQQPRLDDGGRLMWRDVPRVGTDDGVLAPVSAPFSADGGLKLLTGNLGRAVIKTSAVKSEHRVVQAPAIVFDTQEAVIAAFDRGELQRDFVAVVRFQGPRANGMPELHKLTPLLGVLQDQGFHVALVTDGRMSGASGKVPAAIHVTPECLAGGPLALVRDGDMLVLDGERGVLEARVDAAGWRSRQPAVVDLGESHHGMGRELFAAFRANALGAEEGAITFHADEPGTSASAAHVAPVHDHFVFAQGAAK
jgi:phosphogluconate dehydratase